MNFRCRGCREQFSADVQDVKERRVDGGNVRKPTIGYYVECPMCQADNWSLGSLASRAEKLRKKQAD
jgi:hypothetical protein